MVCRWSTNGICQTLVYYPTSKPISCNGHHAVCLGQVGKVRDIRDGPFQIPLIPEPQNSRPGMVRAGLSHFCRNGTPCSAK